MVSLVTIFTHLSVLICKSKNEQKSWKCLNPLEVLLYLIGIWEVVTFIKHFHTPWRLAQIILGKIMNIWHALFIRQTIHTWRDHLTKTCHDASHNFQGRNAFNSLQGMKCLQWLQNEIMGKWSEEWVVLWGPTGGTKRMAVGYSLRG